MKYILLLIALALASAAFGQSNEKLQTALDTVYPHAQVPMSPVAGVAFGLVSPTGAVMAEAHLGVLNLAANSTIGGSAVVALGTITSTSANAFAVGPAGITNPTFNVNAATSSAATGWEIVGAAVTGGVKLRVISSGTNENGTIDAKGSGTLTINGTATGNTIIGSGTGAAVITKARITQENTVYTSDGAIALTSGIAFVEKTSAAAMTVAAPSSQDGTRITIIGNTDFAHVITFTGGTLLDGTTGANTTATMAAFKGASITVVARGTKWLVESLNATVCAP